MISSCSHISLFFQAETLSEQTPMKVGLNKLRYDSHFKIRTLRMVLMEGV